MKLWFCACLKGAFHTKAQQHLLDSADVVFRLVCDPIDLELAVGDDEEAAPAEPEVEEFRRFFHISLMYGNPYKPWLRAMDWPGEVVDAVGDMHLKATDDYFTMMGMLQIAYRTDAECNISFYTLVDAETPIATIDPHLDPCATLCSRGAQEA